MIKILIGCEYSGIVRDAFARKGCYAVSCDLLDTTSPGVHIKGDIIDTIYSHSWDIGIFHPPCTYLSNAQAFTLKHDKDRLQNARLAIEFIDAIWTSNIKHIAIENPVGVVPKFWRSYDQLVYPYQFGDPYSKPICLWLKGLPPLITTCINTQRKSVNNHTNSRMTTAQRRHIRSRFYPLLADAMANQWLSFYNSNAQY